MKMTMKIFNFIILIVSVLAISLASIQYGNVKKLKRENDILLNNIKAYENDISTLEDSIESTRITYKLTVADLEKSKDAIVKELNQERKISKVRDKELKELSHLKATAKMDTTIIISKNDSCEFTAEIRYNDQTVFNVQSRRVNGVDTLFHSADITASFNGITYNKKEWKEPNFFKRLLLFRWGRNVYEYNDLKSDNDMLKIKNFKVIKIIE